jgi:hypothetical protein
VIFTVELAQELLQYPNVVQLRNSEADGYIFSAVPEDERQWSVDLYFNRTCDVVDIVSFGHWHAHYDESENAEENIREAIAAARSLVHRERCVLEECDADGRSLGDFIVEPTGLPETMRKEAKFLRRVVFGQAPQDEAIDYSRYHRAQHIWIALSRKEEIERIYREHGMPFPEW